MIGEYAQADAAQAKTAIAAALAYGNCVVFKPASLVPGSASALAEIIARSGLPDGVFNMVMGSGNTVSNALLTDEGVRAVSLTGSVQTGAGVASACSQRGAKYQLEWAARTR